MLFPLKDQRTNHFFLGILHINRGSDLHVTTYITEQAKTAKFIATPNQLQLLLAFLPQNFTFLYRYIFKLLGFHQPLSL